MPRFDNYGFDPDKIDFNNNRDRSVPDDENYYAGSDNNSGYTSNPHYENLRPPRREAPPPPDRGGYTDLNDYSANYNNYNGYNNGSYNNYGNYSGNGYNRQYSERDLQQFSSDRQPGREPNRHSGGGSGKSRKKRNNNNMRKPGKKFKLPLIIILVLIFALVGGLIAMANSTLGKINYDDKKESVVAAADLKDDSSVTNILLLGVDARPKDEAEASRADTMMMVTIDKKNNCVKLTSFLRDSWVYIPAHNGKQRLNAACTYGGYQGVVDTIEYNFGVKIDGYVVADFEMFKVLVDSIGGVEVDVTEKEAKEVTNHPKRYGNVKLEAGKHTLTGEQALAYCRIRKIDTDWQRTKRQRTVIQSIIKSAKGGNPFTLYKMLNSSAPYIETNLTKGELMKIGVKALGCIKNDMVEAKVPFDGTWKYENIRGASVITLDVDKNKEELIDYIYNKSADEISKEQEKSKNN